MAELEKGTKTAVDIQSFYVRIDHYLSKTYNEQFNINLFN